MRINSEGIALIKRFEGLCLTPYRDVAGHWTVGWGHLLEESQVLQKKSISLEEAEKFFEDDVGRAEVAVQKAVFCVSLNSNQFSALVSWTFNLGEGALRRSTVLERVRARDFCRVPGEMLRWHFAGGRPVAGLVRRRCAEVLLFLAPQKRED